MRLKKEKLGVWGLGEKLPCFRRDFAAKVIAVRLPERRKRALWEQNRGVGWLGLDFPGHFFKVLSQVLM